MTRHVAVHLLIECDDTVEEFVLVAATLGHAIGGTSHLVVLADPATQEPFHTRLLASCAEGVGNTGCTGVSLN